MDALYVHCPFCAFPHVVSRVTAAKSRYCRQCKGVFSPAEGEMPQLRLAHATSKPKRKRRHMALRSILNKR